MIPLILAASLIALASVAIAETPGSRTVFSYVDHLNHERITIAPPQGGKPGVYQFARDALALADFCDDKSAFFCFKSDMNAFAVPKMLGVHQNKWEYDGVTYEIIDRWPRIGFFGQTIPDVLVIRVPSSATPRLRFSKTDVDFLYSQQRGVVGIRFIDENGRIKSLLWLFEEKGFGALP